MTNEHPTSFLVVSAGLALSLALAFSPSTANAGDPERSKVRGSFENTGVDPDAEGSFKGQFRASKSKLKIKLAGLDPDTAYELQLDGVPAAAFTPDRRGRAKLRFETPFQSSSASPLDFDPRGQTVAINDGTDDVLSMVASGPGEPAGIRVEERTLLVAADPNCAGDRAEARFELKTDGSQKFRVRFDGVPPGDYALFVDGIQRAATSLALGDDDGKFEFRSPLNPPALLLDFDTRGQDVAILRGAQICFSGSLEAQAGGVNVCDKDEVGVCLLATPSAGDGEARAELETDDDCEMEFQVKVRAVPEGDLAICVAGLFRGTIEVDTHEVDPNDPQDPNDPRIEYTSRIEFFNPPEDGKLALDFEVDLTQIEVREGDPSAQVGEPCPATTVLFSGAEAVCPQEEACEEEDTEVTLMNLGDPNAPEANADARCEVDTDCDRKFRLRVEDLPPGDYDLLVDGFAGLITVSADVDDPDNTRGDIRFAANPDEPEESPFPAGFPESCAGVEVTIAQGATEFLSGTLAED